MIAFHTMQDHRLKQTANEATNTTVVLEVKAFRAFSIIFLLIPGFMYAFVAVVRTIADTSANIFKESDNQADDSVSED